MEKDSIYPNLESMLNENEKSNVIELPKKKLDEYINSKCFNERLTQMQDKRNQLARKINYYEKIKRKYNITKMTLDTIGVGLTIALTGTTIVLSSGLAIPIFLIPMISGLSMFSITSSSTINKGFIAKKKSKMRLKIQDLKFHLNKLDLLIEKSRSDNTITEEEYISYINLVESINTKNEKKMKKEERMVEMLIPVIQRVLEKK